MTWFEMYQLALLESKLIVPVTWVDPVVGLYHLSTAQHIMQEETSAAKSDYVLALQSESEDGYFDLPFDTRTVETVTYAGEDTVGYGKVDIRRLDELKSIIEGDRLPNTAGTVYTQGVNTLYCAFDHSANKVLLYPYTGSGNVSFRYTPELNSFTPSNATEWGGYGDEPTARMKAEGPHKAFRGAARGMKDYLKAQILLNSPDGLKRWGAEYQVAMQAFQQALEKVRNKQTDYGHHVQTPYYLGGLK